MVDTAGPSQVSSAGSVDPAERGRLVVHDRVVERLAAHAAVDVPGVTADQDLLDKAVRRGLPRVKAQISGRIAAVDIDLAVAWGSPLDEVTSQVRESVRERLHTLAGLEVPRVNVTVKRIVRDRTQEPRVR